MKRTFVAAASSIALLGCGSEAPTEPAPWVHSVELRSRPGDVVVLSDGRILTSTDRMIARYLPDGTPDPSFGAGGFVDMDLVDTLLTVSDDRIFVSGRWPVFFHGSYGAMYEVLAYDIDGHPAESWGFEGGQTFPDFEIQALQTVPTGLMLAGSLPSDQVAWTILDPEGGIVAERTFEAPEAVRVLWASESRLVLSSATSRDGPWEALGYDLTQDGSFRPISPGRTDLRITRLENAGGRMIGCGSAGNRAVLFSLHDLGAEIELTEDVSIAETGGCLDFLTDGDVSRVLLSDSRLEQAVVRSFDSHGRELPPLDRAFAAPKATGRDAGVLARGDRGGLLFAYGDRESARLLMYAPGR